MGSDFQHSNPAASVFPPAYFLSALWGPYSYLVLAAQKVEGMLSTGPETSQGVVVVVE
jgi:hypothetical protein